jgi:hypothetical protein
LTALHKRIMEFDDAASDVRVEIREQLVKEPPRQFTFHL